jgi:hypothetical protein
MDQTKNCLGFVLRGQSDLIVRWEVIEFVACINVSGDQGFVDAKVSSTG